MSIVKNRDVVIIRFVRVNGVRRIVSVVVIGSARPCIGTLFRGGRVFLALSCLLTNGFRIVFRSGFKIVLVRRRIL